MSMRRAWAASIWTEAVHPTLSAQTGHSRRKVALQCDSTEAAIRGAHQHALITIASVLYLADFLGTHVTVIVCRQTIGWVLSAAP
jgi:hypothetical protein